MPDSPTLREQLGFKPCWRGWLFAVCVVAAGLADWWLIAHGRLTISETVWSVEAAHQEVIAAVFVGSVGVGYLVRRSWLLAGLAGYLCCHLANLSGG